MRRVDAVEGDVEEQWFVSGLFADETGGFLGDEMGGVAFFHERFVIAIPIRFAIAVVRVVIQRAKVVSILVVEAATGGGVVGLEFAEVPLAGDGGCVADFLQGLWQQALVQRQAPGGAWPDDIVDAGVGGVATGHQG